MLATAGISQVPSGTSEAVSAVDSSVFGFSASVNPAAVISSAIIAPESIPAVPASCPVPEIAVTSTAADTILLNRVTIYSDNPSIQEVANEFLSL